MKETNILKQILKPNKTCAVFAPDEIFKIIEETLKNLFIPTQLYKFIRCTTLPKYITDPYEQESEIRKYHLANNHKGIDENISPSKKIYCIS